jgi:hypothetical protein
VKVTIVEGTPQEIAEVFPDLNMRQTTVTTPPVAVATPRISDATEHDEQQYVTVEVARSVLNRRPLSKEQLLLLRELYNAHPGTVSGVDLQAKLGYSRPQFTGLMGAMGRRFTHTEGFVEGTWFFQQEWDYKAATNRYGLPETVREAMRREKLV